MRELIGLAMFGGAIATGFWLPRIAKNEGSQVYAWVVLILGVALMFGSLVSCNAVAHVRHALQYGI